MHDFKILRLLEVAVQSFINSAKFTVCVTIFSFRPLHFKKGGGRKRPNWSNHLEKTIADFLK